MIIDSFWWQALGGFVFIAVFTVLAWCIVESTREEVDSDGTPIQ